MRAGRLRSRLLLQQQTETRDAYGGAVIGWSTTATVWGAVESLFGFEATTADQVSSQLQVRVVIRYGSAISAIDTTWRVKDKNTGTAYDISSVMLPSQRSASRGDVEMLCFQSKRDDE